MNKLAIRVIFSIAGLGLLVSALKIVEAGVELDVIGFFIFGLMPYLAFLTLAYWFRPPFIAYITGGLVLALDLFMHLYIFVYPSDIPTSLFFISSPIYLTVLCVILFILLKINFIVIECFQCKKISTAGFKELFTTRNVFLYFVLPLTITLLVGNIGFFLMNFSGMSPVIIP
jgi:hypothetical protein